MKLWCAIQLAAKNAPTTISAGGRYASRVSRGAFHNVKTETSAKNDKAGNSQAAVNAAKNPHRANTYQRRSPSYQIRKAADSVIAAQTAARKWLFNAPANVVKNLTSVATAIPKIPPQSLW